MRSVLEFSRNDCHVHKLCLPNPPEPYCGSAWQLHGARFFCGDSGLSCSAHLATNPIQQFTLAGRRCIPSAFPGAPYGVGSAAMPPAKLSPAVSICSQITWTVSAILCAPDCRD